MTYTEEQNHFFEELYTELEKAMKPEGASLERVDVPKNNTVQEGISIRFEGQPISPTVYPSQFYRDFQNGVSVEEIVFYIKDGLTAESITKRGIMELNHDNAPHYLRSAIVSYEGNREWLKDVPHERVADLALYAKWDFGGGYSAKVTNPLLAHLQMTREELLRTAKGNMAMQARLRTMKDALIARAVQGGMPEELTEEMRDQLPDIPFYVLNVNGGIDGAALVADPSVMRKAGRDLGEGFYILPSSVHEVLIVPKSTGAKPEELRDMVYRINRQEVPIEERLSDNVYEFDGHTLTLAGQTETLERELPGLAAMHRRR